MSTIEHIITHMCSIVDIAVVSTRLQTVHWRANLAVPQIRKSGFVLSKKLIYVVRVLLVTGWWEAYFPKRRRGFSWHPAIDRQFVYC